MERKRNIEMASRQDDIRRILLCVCVFALSLLNVLEASM
jgi:hypothetical protein